MVYDFRFDETAKLKNLHNYTLIEGFPGMGLVGTIAAKYLIDSLKMKEVGHIENKNFMPVVRVHNGIPIYPARIYIDNKRKLLALISEQIIPNELTHNLAESVVNWIREKKIKRMISLAGIKTPEPQKEVYGIASKEHGLRELKKYKISIIDDGITTGVTAMLLIKLKKYKNITAYALLGDVKFSADYQAASMILKKLNEILNLKIDVKPLMQEAKKTEEALIANLRKLKETHTSLSEYEQQAPMTT